MAKESADRWERCPDRLGDAGVAVSQRMKCQAIEWAWLVHFRSNTMVAISLETLCGLLHRAPEVGQAAIAMLAGLAGKDELAALIVQICNYPVGATTERTEGKAGFGIAEAETAAILNRASMAGSSAEASAA